jgi:hypothetical protein
MTNKIDKILIEVTDTKRMLKDHIVQDSKDKAVIEGRVIKCENGMREFKTVQEKVKLGIKVAIVVTILAGGGSGAVAAINHCFGSISNLFRIMGGG